MSEPSINLNEGSVAAQWRSSGPLKHVFLPSLISASDSVEIFNEMETALALKRGTPRKYKHRNVFNKMGTQNFENCPVLTTYMSYFISEPFVARLRVLTGIQDLFGDPNFFGGGIAEMGPGGYLKSHRDFNIHSDTGQYRRLNLLVYVNPEWRKDWGGGIRLWNEQNRVKLAEFFGEAGDAVLFETSEISYHEVPPIATHCPAPRRSLALYYFSNNWPEGVPVRKNTDYQLTPSQWADLMDRLWDDGVEGSQFDEIVELMHARKPDPYLYQRSDIEIGLTALKQLYSECLENSQPRDAHASSVRANLLDVARAMESGQSIESLPPSDPVTQRARLMISNLLSTLRSKRTRGDPYNLNSYL